jgi:predicted TIM-barrel fold metal-dependent hydrolase
MIIDAHTHVWLPHPEYPGRAATIVSPLCAVPVEVLDQYLDEHGVQRAVLVQPIYPGEDNSYVADCAAARPERFAAVCVVSPFDPTAPDRLDYWVRDRAAKGLRLRPRLPAEAAVFGHPSTFGLWERAQELGVVVSVLASAEHLPTVAELAGRFSTVPVVIDHMAHPDVVSGVNGPGFRSLLELARFSNIAIKVSGYYNFSRQAYPYADCQPLFRALFESFGPQRLLWGSDFPHVLLKAGYRRSLLLQERAYPFLSSADLELIMGQNARRLYWNS